MAAYRDDILSQHSHGPAASSNRAPAAGTITAAHAKALGAKAREVRESTGEENEQEHLARLLRHRRLRTHGRPRKGAWLVKMSATNWALSTPHAVSFTSRTKRRAPGALAR
jgi:hypothetical protein